MGSGDASVAPVHQEQDDHSAFTQGTSASTLYGLSRLHLTHGELRYLFEHQEANSEWRARLAAVAGVYLILATTTGRQYVGSATGIEGLWGRWAAYAVDGHGG